jgi:alcohol dehydrogenase (cytochrome c)
MHARMTSTLRIAFVTLAFIAPSILAQQRPPGVTVQDLRDGLKDPSRWLMYAGDYTGQRHSPLNQLTPANVSHLAVQWTFQTDQYGLGRGIQSIPLALDGVLYFSGNNSHVYAIDPRSGRQIWQYAREMPSDVTRATDRAVNRGLGVLGDKLFLGTLDAHVVALDIKTGKQLWDTTVSDYHTGLTNTSAPLIVGKKLILGLSGGDRANRCFLDAYDTDTGKRLWRFFPTPDPGQPGSETWSNNAAAALGGATWANGSYDPESNLLYWGTGNPYGAEAARLGDNLYTASLVALDADTGKLRWYYQVVPHDKHDYDAAVTPVLGDVTLDGAARKVVLFAPKVGYLYVFDRATGKLLAAHPVAETAQNWAREISPDGHPVLVQEDGTQCLPDAHGATNFWPPSYDQSNGLFFLTVHETCTIYNFPARGAVSPAPGSWIVGGAGYAAVRAVDPVSGEQRWEFRYPPSDFGVTAVTGPRAGYGMGQAGGLITTAGGLLFTGDNEGNFIALDERTGKPLWHFQTGAPVWGSAPMTYMLDGRQHVMVSSGLMLFDFAITR